MESFSQHLEQYDSAKLENALQLLMKQLAATLSRQRGVQYEFGPEYDEYKAKKAAGILGQTHLKPLSEIFTEEQLHAIPIDNKVGENYFGHFSEQLREKGGSSFKVISDRLILKSSANIAFAEGAEQMLRDKELKVVQKEVNQIEAEWSMAQKDVVRSKLSLSNSEADKLAKEQSKNKLLSLCLENGQKFKYNAPVSSQEDVNQLYSQIHKHSEQDQLAVMRQEIKFKKVVFSELPNDFVLFKQYNISAKQMYQNLLALHSVDAAHQEVVSVEDIFAITDSMDSFSIGKQAKKSKAKTAEQVSTSPMSDWQWPPQEEDFIITLGEAGWSLGCTQSYDEDRDVVCVQALAPLKTRAKDDMGKTYWIYPDEKEVNFFEQKNVQKDLVLALLNREIFDSIVGESFGEI